MMKRFIYIAQYREGAGDFVRAALDAVELPVGVVMANASGFGRNLFFYYECDGVDIAPEAFLSGLIPHLEPIPFREQPRFFAPMLDIYHYHEIRERADWRKEGFGTPWVRLAKIKPDMMSSYIFYHYQLQEEYPGEGPKHGIIAMHENLLFFYMEKPFIEGKGDYKGKLDTKNSPRDIWGALMNEHFEVWPDFEGPWRDDMEVLMAKKGCGVEG